jgi:hypothetical protein
MQENLFQEAQRHFNQPILIGFDLCRCIGYGEDDEDCYLIVRDPHQEKLRWCTFVGGYTYLNILKGQDQCKSSTTGEEWNDYTRLDSLLELNGAPKEKEFICKVEEKIAWEIDVSNDIPPHVVAPIKPYVCKVIDYDSIMKKHGLEDKMVFHDGDLVLMLGEIEHMPGHVVVVTRDGIVRWAYHTENFQKLTKDEV